MADPSVSVCVPAYNAARFVGETVASVLAQSYEDFELVVVDDASTDGTGDAVAAFSDPRLRLVRNPVGLGLQGNWNRAMHLARGRYVKLLCHDDLLAPGCLAAQVATLESHPETVMVAGKRDVIDESGRVLLRGRGLPGLSGVIDGGEAVRATVRSGTNIFGEPLCVLMRAEHVAACGPFTASRPYMIDLDYWCRLLARGPLFAQSETVGAFRVALTSLSFQLAGRQSREAVGLLRELGGRWDSVRRSDVARGAVKATALATARATTYRLMSVRGQVDCTPAVDVAATPRS